MRIYFYFLMSLFHPPRRKGDIYIFTRRSMRTRIHIFFFLLFLSGCNKISGLLSMLDDKYAGFRDDKPGSLQSDALNYAKYYQIWNDVLGDVVVAGEKDAVKLSLVKYEELSSHAGFRKLTAWLENAEVPEGKKDENLSFWINAYNIYVFRLISENGTPISIWKISGDKVFDTGYYKVAGTARSLNQIEKGIIKPLKEPLACFALACPAVSCPDISKSAYTPENLRTQLENQAKEFLLNPGKGVRLDHDSGIVYVSTLGKWNADAFYQLGGFQKFSSGFFNDEDKEAINSYKVEWIPFNWNRN